MLGPILCSVPGIFYTALLLLSLVNPRGSFGLGLFMVLVGVTVMPIALLAAAIYSASRSRINGRYKASLVTLLAGVVSIGLIILLLATRPPSHYVGP